jgi:hypothetical protein
MDDDDDNDISAWKNIRENIKASATESLDYELKQRQSWFNEEYPKLLDQRN